MRFTSFAPELVAKGAFWRSVLLPAGAFLLLSAVGLSSSSEADEPLFARSVQQLERLWGGVLGCTYPGDGVPHGVFETTFDNVGVPSAVRHDYVECGKRALRNTSSRMLVSTIEDALRQGGVALFDKRFRLDSNIGWTWGGNVTGDIEALIPILSMEYRDRTGHALFLQPGAVFWPGIEGEDRIDGSIGLVYRQHITRHVVGGGSVFFDYDFEREGQRLGLGLDLQSGLLHAALNYYHPLSDWQEGRPDYEEQPLRGMDLRFGLVWARLQFDTSLGIWRFEGEEEERAEWRPAIEVEAGYRVLPGVFLRGGYKRHDSGDSSLGSRWNAGLLFRFSLPGFKGAIGDKRRAMAQPDLWEPVKRERRILYEEREAIPPIRLTPRTANNEPLTTPVEEGGRTMIVGELVPLSVPVTLDLVVDDASTAELGIDFSYGHRVYELDAQTGGQRAPSDTTGCPDMTCEIAIPAGVTRFDVEVDILDDATPREIPEEVVLRVDIPEEHRRLIRGGRTSVTIEGHGNTVGFAPGSADELMENGGTGRVTVDVDLPSPTPIALQVEAGGTAVRGTDYRAPAGLAIPAGAGGATLTLTGIDNGESGGNKTITLTLSGNLPEGWEYAARTHNITLRDDDLSIGFTGSNNPAFVDEGDTVELTLAANQPLPEAATVAWSVDLGGDVTSGDFSGPAAGTLGFQQNDDGDDLRTITLRLNDDTAPEDAEEVTVTLNEAGSSLPDGWSLGGSRTFTIDSNDGTVTFADAAVPLAINEGETRAVRVVSTAEGPRGGYPLRVSFSPSASGQIGFPETFSLPAGQDAATFNITVNSDDVPEEAVSYTMSLSPGSSAPAGWTASSTRTVTVPFSDGRIGFAAASITAVEGGSHAEAALTMNPPPVSNTAISMSITGNAQEGTDYTRMLLADGSSVAYRDGFVYPANAASVTFRFLAVEDNDEVGERATYRITGFPAGYSAGANTSLQVILNDNDVGRVQPTIEFSSPASSAAEGGSHTIGFTLRNADTFTPFNVTVTAAGDTHNDDIRSGNTVPINTAQNPAWSVNIHDSDLIGNGRTLTLTLTAPSGWGLGAQTTHTLTITPDSDTGTVAFAQGTSSVVEPANGTVIHNVPLTISRMPADPFDLVINGAGEGGDARFGSSANDDANANSPVTVSSTAISGTTLNIPVTIRADNDSEIDEVIVLTIPSGSGNGLPAGLFSRGSQHTHRITIPANDNTVSFSANAGTITEGSTTPFDIILDIDRPLPAGTTASVTLDATHNGTATSGDYEFLPPADSTANGTISGSVWTLPTGQSTATLQIRAVDDGVNDDSESVTFELDNLTGATGWTLESGTLTVTIADDEETVNFASGNPATANEGDTIELAVVSSAAPSSNLEFNWNVSPSAAIAPPSGSGSFSGTGSVTIPAGETRGTFNVTIRQNDGAEYAETVTFRLVDANTGDSFISGGNTSHAVNIPANENTIAFSSGAGTVEEMNAATPFSIVLNINRPLPAGTVARVTLAPGGTATSNDYTLSPASGNNGSLNNSNVWTLPTGTGTATLEITAVDDPDNDDFDTEQVIFTLGSLTGATGWTLGSGTQTVNIIDDDDPPAAGGSFRFASSVSSIKLTEGDTNGAEFRISFDNPPLPTQGAVLRIAFESPSGSTSDSQADVTDVSFTAQTANGMAATYSESAQTLTIPGGATSPVTLTVTADDDSTPEVEEEFILRTVPAHSSNVFPSSAYSLVENSYTVAIAANDNTVQFATPANATISEEQATATPVTLRINRPIPSAHTGTVTVAVGRGGSADETDDYVISGNGYSNGVLTLGAGQQTAMFTVTAVDDSDYDPGDDTITLSLSSISGAPDAGWDVGDEDEFTITIADNDAAPVTGTIGFADNADEVAEPDSGGTPFPVAVALSTAPAEDVTVPISVDTTATTASFSGASADVTFTPSSLTFAAGTTTLSQDVTFTVHADDNKENDKIIRLLIGSDASYTGGANAFSLGQESFELTIPANDNTITFGEPSSAGIAESGGSATITATIDLAIPAGTASPPTVTITPQQGSGHATMGTDYSLSVTGGNLNGNTWTLPTGGNGTLTVTAIDDSLDEGGETVVLAINPGTTSLAGWSTTAATHTITIEDDDGSSTVGFSASGTEAEAIEGESSSANAAFSRHAEVFIDISAGLPEAFDLGIEIDPSSSNAEEGDYATRVIDPAGESLDDGVIRVPSGATTVSFIVTAIDDGDTDDETIIFNLSGTLPAGFSFADRSHTVTIRDRRAVAFSNAYATALEGSGSPVTTALIVNPAPASQVEIPVIVTVENGSEINPALTAGSAAISTAGTTSSANITVDTTGSATLSLAANADSGSEGGRVTVAIDSANLPGGYDEGRRNSWAVHIHDAAATPVNFAQSALDYNDAALSAVITSGTTAFPEGVTLVVKNSDETGTVIGAPRTVPLPGGETRTTFEVVPRGGVGEDVTLTLADPEGTLPFDWRIGDDDTLTLTRTNAPSDKTINLLPSAKNGDPAGIDEGTPLELIAQALGAAPVPPEGINLSLTVESVYLEPDPDNSGGTIEVPGSAQPAGNLFGFKVPGFKAGAVLPDPYPSDLLEKLSQEEQRRYREERADLSRKANTYTFKLTEEHSAANIFGAVADDDIIENPEKITFTLAPDGPLPSGWSMGTAEYVITIPANGARVGFASNLPTRTVESAGVTCPSTSLRGENFIRLPFETVYPDKEQNTFKVEVTGVDSTGNRLSNIYSQVEVTGQVRRDNREFTARGNGRVQTTDVGIFVCADDTAELAQILTIKVTPVGQHPANTVEGRLTHEITVLPSDNSVTFAPNFSSGSIAQESGTATIGVTISNEIPASGEGLPSSILSLLPFPQNNGEIPFPAVLIVPAATNGALPGDYSLSASGGRLESLAASGFDTGKHLWTLPTGTGSATLTVTSNVDPAVKEAVLALEFSAADATLGWQVPDGTTRTITLGGTSADGTVGFVAPDSTAIEGEGNTTFNVPVIVSAAPASAFDLNVSVSGTSSATQGTDFTVPSTLRISDSGRANLAVQILDDSDIESESETIVLEISSTGIPAGLTLDSGAAGHTITIPPNDNTIAFAYASSSATEGGAAATVNIAIDSPLPLNTSAHLRIDTKNSNGAGASDYVITGAGYSRGILTLSGSTGGTATLTVRAVSDSKDEDGESVTLVLGEYGGSLPEGWELGEIRRHVVTLDEEPSTTVGISSFFRSVEIKEQSAAQGRAIDLDIGDSDALAAALANDITLPTLVTIEGDEEDPADFENDVTVGQVSISAATGQGRFNVSVLPDSIPEHREVVTVALQNGSGQNALPNGWSIDSGNNTVAVIIPANDNTIGFSAASSEATEGDNAGTAIDIAINRPLPAGTTARVNVGMTNTGTATAGDYTITGNGYSGGVLTLPVAPNDKATLTIVAAADAVDPNEGVTLTLTENGGSFPDGWELGTTEHVVTFIDGAPTGGTVGFASGNSATATEGGSITLTVESTAAPGADIVFDWSVNDSADGNDDITADNGTVTILATQRSGTFDVAVRQDADAEDAEQITVTLTDRDTSDSFELDSSSLTHVFTIDAEDNTVGFAAASSEATEGDNTGTAIAININQPLPAGTTASVTIGITNTGTTTASDYTITGNGYSGGVLTLPTASDTPNDTATLTIVAAADSVDPNEGVTLTLTENGGSFPDGWEPGTTEHVVTFIDGAPTGGTVGFASVNPATATEGGSVTLTVESSAAPGADIVFDWSANDTADGDDDITVDDGTVTILATETSGTFDVAVRQDAVAEDAEQITVTLTTDRNTGDSFELDSSSRTHVFTIDAEDNTVGFAAASSEATEGDNTGTAIDITIDQPFPSGTTASVTVGITNTGTTTAGDYTITGNGYSGGILTLPTASDTPNDTATLTIVAVADAVDPNEGVTLTLTENGGSFPDGWEPGTTEHVVTFIDGAPPSGTVGFASGNPATATEGGSVTLTVESTVAPGADIVFDWSLNDSADGNDDITVDNGTVTILATETSGTFDVAVRQDAVAEDAEQITVTLTTDRNTGDSFELDSSSRTHVFTIAAEDNSISFAPEHRSNSVIEDVAGGRATLTITLSNPAPVGGLPLKLTATGVTGVISFDETGSTDFLDFTIQPADGTTKEVPVFINDNSDDADPDAQIVTFTLTEQQGASPAFPSGWGSVITASGSNVHTLTVVDDENSAPGGTIGFKEEMTRVLEPGSGETIHPVTLTVDGGFTGDEFILNVAYGGTADRVQQAGVLALDYAASETVTVPARTAGDFTFDVTIRGDELIEIDETVNITIDETRLPGYLTAVQNGTTHVITIPANDNEVVFGNTTRVNEEDGKEERVTVSIAQAGPSGPDFVAPPGGVPLRISVLSSKVAPGGNFNIPPGADSGGEISFDKDDPAVYFADIEIEAGQKEVAVPIYIVGDQDEDSEVIRLQIEPQPGAAFPDEWGRVVRQRPPNTARFDRHTIHLTDTGILNPTGTLDFAIASSMADEGDTHIIEIDTTANIPPQGVAMMLAAAGTDITEDAEVTDTSTDPDTVSRITDGATVTATLMPADASATPSRPKPYISVRIINDSTSEPEETLRLTMLQTGLPDTLTVGTNITHDITISTSNNTVRFLAGADSSTTDEDTDMVTFTVDVPDEHQPAPVGGIPMKITATGEDAGVVSFDENDDTVDSKDISIGEGGRSAEVTVYILPDDDIENETVRFVLTPRDGFPEAWGSILASANTYTLEITDTGPLEPFVGFLEDETFGFEGSPARIEFETNTLLPLDVTLNLRAPNDWIGRSQTLTDAKYNGNPITFLYAGRIRPGVLDVSIRPPSTPGGNPFIIIDIAEDTFPENREWLELTLDTSNSSDPDLVVKGKSVHTIRVDSNDQHAALESSEGTVREDQEVAHIGIFFSGELPRNGLNMGMRVISGNENNVVSLSPDGAQNEIRFTVPYSGARRWDVPVYLKFDEDREDNRVEFRLFAQNSVGGFKLVPWGDISFGRTRYILNITDVGIPPIGNVGFAGERTTALEPDASASPLNHTVPLVVKGEVRTAFDLTIGVDSNSTSLTNGISPNDFTAPSVVTIPVKAAGSRDHRINVTVPIAADTAPEPDETIILTIGREDLPVADGIISGQNTSHIVTIPVNDQQLALSANPAGSTSFDETAGQAGVRVQLTSSSAASGGALPQGGLPLRVEITEGNEDSVASFEETYLIEYHDFTVTSLPFDFPLYFRPDADNQPETIKLSLSTRSGFPSGWGGVDASLNTVTFTLTDSVSGGGAGVGPFPPSAMIGFVGSSIAVSEPPDGSGETQHEVQINVSGTVLESFNPDITLSQGGSSGLADSSDYRIGTSLPLNVARGFEGMKSVLVFISDDDVPEAAETLTLTIDESTLPKTVGLLDGAATFDVEIGANDNTIEIVPPSPAPANYDNPAEGDTRQITIRANNPSVLPDGGIAVNFAIDPAESASVSPASHTFEEVDGSGSPAHTVELTLTVTEDMIAEQEESFTFSMTAADTSRLVGWEIGEGSMFTVQPSSGPARHSIGFASPQSSSVHEGDSKELTVQLSEAHEQPILIAVDVEPADYADEIELSAGGSSFSAGDMLTVDANSSTATLDVMIKDDQDFERAEDFTFTLSSATTSEISFPSNYFFEDHVYTLTVPDNDIGFDFVTDAIELEEDTTSDPLVLNVTDTVDFEFVREVSFVNQHGEESNRDVTLQVTNPAGLTGNVWDAVSRTLTIPANTQNLSFTVTAVDDGVGEGREVVSVNVLEGERVVDTLAVTIPANDNTINLAVQHPASPATTLNEGVPYELAIDIAAPLDAPAKLRIAALERDTFSTDPTHRNYPADLGFSVKGGIGSFEADASSAPEVVSQQQGGVNCRPLSSECRRTARGTLTIPAGVPQVVLLVTAVDDEVGERNETVSVEITPLAGGDALPEAWELAIPRQTRFSIPDNDNEMNFVDTDETVLEGQTTRKINIVQEESFPFGFTTKANVVITGTNGGAAEDIEIRRSDDGDVTYDAASGVMTVMDHQASFVIHAVADEGREGPETVTITLVEPGGADAYPEGYDIGDNDSFTVTIPANGNLLSFAKPADVPRNPNIIGCRGFHEDNDARLCALEQPGENIRPFDFNYIRSVVIDSPFTATQTVKITHNDTDAGSDDGQYTIRLADGNPGGTGWRRIDGQSGILTIPAGAAEIRLDMWFRRDNVLELPGDQDFTLTLEEDPDNRLPGAWKIDPGANTLPMRILNFNGVSETFAGDRDGATSIFRNAEEGSSFRITMETVETMPAGGVPIYLYMSRNTSGNKITYNGTEFPTTVENAMEVTLLPGTDNGASGAPSSRPYFDVDIDDDDVMEFSHGRDKVSNEFILVMDTGFDNIENSKTIAFYPGQATISAAVLFKSSDNEIRFATSSSRVAEGENLTLEIEVAHPTRHSEPEDRKFTNGFFNPFPEGHIRARVVGDAGNNGGSGPPDIRAGRPEGLIEFDSNVWALNLDWATPRFLLSNADTEDEYWRGNIDSTGNRDFRSTQDGVLYIPARDRNASGPQKISLNFTVPDDGLPEDEETYIIRLMDAGTLAGHPPYPSEGGWGISPTRYEHRVTIPANENSVTLTGPADTSVSESCACSVDVNFRLTNPAPPGGVPLVLTLPNPHDDVSFHPTNKNEYVKEIRIEEGRTNLRDDVPIYISGNEIYQPNDRHAEVTVTQGTNNFPTSWGSVPTSSLRITITDDDIAPPDNLIGFGQSEFLLREPDSATAVNTLQKIPMSVGGDPVRDNTSLTFDVILTGHVGDISLSPNPSDKTPAVGGLNRVTAHLRNNGGDLNIQPLHDLAQESVEVITMTIPANQTFPAGWGLDATKDTIVIRIDSNDNRLEFRNKSATVDEGSSATIIFNVSGRPLHKDRVRLGHPFNQTLDTRHGLIPVDLTIHEVDEGRIRSNVAPTSGDRIPIDLGDFSFSPDELVTTKRIWVGPGMSQFVERVYTHFDTDDETETAIISILTPDFERRPADNPSAPHVYDSWPGAGDLGSRYPLVWNYGWGWDNPSPIASDRRFVLTIRDTTTVIPAPQHYIGFTGENFVTLKTDGGAEGMHTLTIGALNEDGSPANTPFPRDFTATITLRGISQMERFEPGGHQSVFFRDPDGSVSSDSRRTINFMQGQTSATVDFITSNTEAGVSQAVLAVGTGDSLPDNWHITDGMRQGNRYFAGFDVESLNPQWNGVLAFDPASITLDETPGAGPTVCDTLLHTYTPTIRKISGTFPANFPFKIRENAVGTLQPTLRFHNAGQMSATLPRHTFVVGCDAVAEVDETIVVSVEEIGLPEGVTLDPARSTFTVHVNPSDNKLFVRARGGVANNYLYETSTRTVPIEIVADKPLRSAATVKLVATETDGDGQPDVTISSGTDAAYDPSTGNLTLTPNSGGVYSVNVAVVANDGPDQAEDIAFTLAAADSGGNIPAGWDIDNSRNGEGSDNGNIIHIPANNNTIGWAENLLTESLEPDSGDGEIILTIDVDKPLVQDVEIILRITNNGANDFHTIEVAPNSVDRMTYNKQTGHLLLPVIGDGATNTEYRIRLIRSNDTVAQTSHEVRFILQQATGTRELPEGWTIARDVHVITVQDNDTPPSGSSPPRLPDPVRPPTQETSPTDPPDKFQKEANADP